MIFYQDKVYLYEITGCGDLSNLSNKTNKTPPTETEERPVNKIFSVTIQV